MIDWMGNEGGIRISSLLNMLESMTVPQHMEKYKKMLLAGLDHSPYIPSAIGGEGRLQSSSSVNVSSNLYSMNRSENSQKKIQYFEIQLSQVKKMQDDWKENAETLVPGLLLSEPPLYPMSTEKAHRDFYYIEIASEKNPWEIAAELEGLPQIDTCTPPDLEMLTDIKPGHYGRWSGNESLESLDDGTADWKDNETDFKIRWANASMVKESIAHGDYETYRYWNRVAIGADKKKDYEQEKRKSAEEKQIEKKKERNRNVFLEEDDYEYVKDIKVIQLDTGYTDHSKVLDGYNLLEDEDFIDGGEDARDEMSMGILRQPGHGTRTASLVIGNLANGKIDNDGNHGISVTDKGTRLLKVIPYRISKSVVLIGRGGRNLFNAVSQAINAQADVIFMCMGSYPRPMIYSIAKTAYERGIIWVCAAGNMVESVIAPAVYPPGTIAVAASNPNNEPWRHTSYGPAVDIAAPPGEDVYVPFLSKKKEDIMVFGSGTSYATPHVATAAALWKAKNQEVLKYVKEPWQIVELFRYKLKETANKKIGIPIDLGGQEF